MGLFVQRPEEPSEWAGLPGEPVRPRTRAELLPDEDQSASRDVFLGLGDAATTSVAIPLDLPSDANPTDGD